MWQKVIMKINVNYLFHCKRLTPYKDKHYVQIVHVSLSSLSQGTSHCTIHCYHCSVPWYCPDFRTVGYFTVLYCFSMYFILGFDLFNKHVEKDFLQHGLGTPYSNSACFDKDDIWNFCSFLYSACQLHYFSPSP